MQTFPFFPGPSRMAGGFLSSLPFSDIREVYLDFHDTTGDYRHAGGTMKNAGANGCTPPERLHAISPDNGLR